ADEQRVEALLGEDLVEDVREPAVGLHELRLVRHAGARAGQQPQARLATWFRAGGLWVYLVPQNDGSFTGGQSLGSPAPARSVSPERGKR
ncbi:MAG: hypothetical protein V7644_127, partial [Actinomycetota bacterium]